jgi:hypothetical protein
MCVDPDFHPQQQYTHTNTNTTMHVSDLMARTVLLAREAHLEWDSKPVVTTSIIIIIIIIIYRYYYCHYY